MPAETVLLLAGTGEAGDLARRIARERPADRLIVSLAGRTAAPAPVPGEVRVGGFGGGEGLAAFIRAERVTRLVDATHPFAQQISRNAAWAAATAAVRRVALLRPAWVPIAGDRWIAVDGPQAAANALPARSRAFLALGRQHLAPFAGRADVGFAVRMIDPPAAPLSFAAQVVLGKPFRAWRDEAALFRRLGATHLVSRNAGGAASYAKIEAARHLALAVVMIDRVADPEPPVARDADAVMRWLAD